LSLFSIFSGFFFYDIFLGLGTPFFGNSIYVLLFHYSFLDSEIISPFLKNLPIFFFFGGIFLGLFIYKFFSFFFDNKSSNLYYFYIYIVDFLLPLCSSAFFFNFFYILFSNLAILNLILFLLKL